MDTGIFIGDKIITTSWDKIWNKPTTLSGYGITDAYTQSDADGRFSDILVTQLTVVMISRGGKNLEH